MAGVCSGCDPCNSNCKKQCCHPTCLQWGFDGCYLRGRCPDGTELDPLNLCEWLDVHETCTTFELVPNSEHGAVMRYTNECDVVEDILICDFLGLGTLECLGNVYDEEASPCDLLVYSPDCGDELDPRHNQWSHYHIPDAGDCEIQPDAQGFYKVLIKDDCGCIKECKLFASSQTWEYSLRDSWPDDPDWPFTVGTFTEVIDTLIHEKCPMFGKTDLKVTVQYGYGIQKQGHVSNNMTLDQYHHFKSTVIPTSEPTPSPSTGDMYQNAMTVAGPNLCPWGSHEWQVSRTIIVPKGQRLYLCNQVEERDYWGNLVPQGATGPNPGEDCSRLHALRIFVETTQGRRM